ncbi:hypothetical protein MYK68_18590 [Gordonia sp. PP30]|uniref:hypothetical protein n=1 Tax=Gordonia sp. PP30 TaxID=2935861 RepID=UPI00200045EE|nr:hypothetical protein [Gordonia sp. PP30]UQE74693.1 hypothetical protein MYK68_18590 [Gordonia sp. PP30]
MSPHLSSADVQLLRAALDAEQARLTARRKARQAMPPRARALDTARRSILAKARNPATRGALRQACSCYRYGGLVSAHDVADEVLDELIASGELAITGPATGQHRPRYSRAPVLALTHPSVTPRRKELPR